MFTDFFFFLNEWPSAVLSDHSCCDIVVTGLIIWGFTSLSFVMFQSELVIKTNKALFFIAAQTEESLFQVVSEQHSCALSLFALSFSPAKNMDDLTNGLT